MAEIRLILDDDQSNWFVTHLVQELYNVHTDIDHIDTQIDKTRELANKKLTLNLRQKGRKK